MSQFSQEEKLIFEEFKNVVRAIENSVFEQHIEPAIIRTETVIQKIISEQKEDVENIINSSNDNFSKITENLLLKIDELSIEFQKTRRQNLYGIIVIITLLIANIILLVLK